MTWACIVLRLGSCEGLRRDARRMISHEDMLSRIRVVAALRWTAKAERWLEHAMPLSMSACLFTRQPLPWHHANSS
jgi:hypothetical protein